MTELKGKCLCGKIEIHSKSSKDSFGACHCNMCRRWCGGPLFAISLEEDVKFTNENEIQVFTSSNWAERGFCKTCGSSLFYRLKQNQHYHVPVGLFENTNHLKFDHQLFIEEKPENYSFSNETKNITGEELFAMFSGE